MKRILQIPNYYYPHIGGIEKTCQYLSEGLSDEYEVRVVCFSENKEDKVEQLNGVKLFKAGVFLDIARQSLSLSYFKILRSQIKEWKPDIIHFHYPNPFVTALLLPLIPKSTKLYVHYHLDITKQKKIYPFIKPFETALLKRADMIVTTSPAYLESSKPLTPFKSKIDILPSAVNVHDFDLTDADKAKVEEIKRKFGNKKIVFYVGRHVAHKGVGELVTAASLIKNDCAIIVGGSGPITEQVKAECESVKVKFIGRVSDADMKLYYHVADIFAFPSYTKAEAFGLTLVEAMYCNTPTVTFTIDGSGVNWVSLNGETGIEVPNRDVKAFASAIDTLLADDELRKRLAISAHARALQMFSVDEEVRILKSHYKRLLQ